MNWRAEAIEKLKHYDAMRQATMNIPMELKRLKLDAQSIRTAKYTGASGKCDPRGRENALVNNLEQRQALTRSLQRARSWLQVTDRAMSALSEEEELILHRLYVCPERGAMGRLCNELGVETSSVYRKRDRALQRFTLALFGDLGEIGECAGRVEEHLQN